jgi:hypothetical protein
MMNIQNIKETATLECDGGDYMIRSSLLEAVMGVGKTEALALGKLYQQRRAEGLDAGATNAVAMPMMGQGQGFFNQAIRGPNANWMNPNNLQAPSPHQAKEGLLMPSPTLQGGVSAQGVESDPFSQGIVDPKIMQSYLGKGVDAAKEVVSAQQAQYGLGQKDRQLSEMIRSNRADEGLSWYNAKTGRISATKPTGGASDPLKEQLRQQAVSKGEREAILQELRVKGFTKKGIGEPETIDFDKVNKDLAAKAAVRKLELLNSQLLQYAPSTASQRSYSPLQKQYMQGYNHAK